MVLIDCGISGFSENKSDLGSPNSDPNPNWGSNEHKKTTGPRFCE